MTTTDFFWKAAPEGIKPGDGSIQVFGAPLDVSPNRLEELAKTLSPDEWRRAERFHLDRDRQRFVVGRGTLREILGTLLDVNPARLVFSYGNFGKPQIARPRGTRALQFNVAHSESVAVYAIADREIGVDIERIRPMDDAKQIAARFFSPREERSLCSVPAENRLEAFFNCWTRKEAYLKAIGSGLDEWLAQVEVSLLPGEEARILAMPVKSNGAGRWFLHAISPAPEFIGAVAYPEKETALQCWTWRKE